MTKTSAKARTPVADTTAGEATVPRASVNMITLKSRAVQHLLSGKGVPRPDVTIPRSQRTMGGLDIEEWRGGWKLSKFDAEAALGFRSTTLYNQACSLPVLPVTTEILIRLYDEKPEPSPWSRLSFRSLFDLMYKRYLDQFDGRDFERAKVDLQARFTVMFGRSTTRAYSWLPDNDDSSNLPQQASSYADVERILCKLTQWDDPAGVFERVASRSLQLRGVDIDELFPIPTRDRPPERGRPGRKPAPVLETTPRRRRGYAHQPYTNAPASAARAAGPAKVGRKPAAAKKKPAAEAKKAVAKRPAAAAKKVPARKAAQNASRRRTKA
ncbi:MAG: hypothetical protein K0Q43_176 [Ramlibacter sp.]|jgi:hypothetical protein|nr:hypothetical protein [Ramlibacter sp.]